jgi:hypothetical protein
LVGRLEREFGCGDRSAPCHEFPILLEIIPDFRLPMGDIGLFMPEHKGKKPDAIAGVVLNK